MTATISRILVPLDFSTQSDLALEYATTLAARMDASLHLLHVVDPVPVTAAGAELVIPTLPEMLDSMVADARRVLADYHASLAPGVRASTEVAFGIPSATICDVAGTQKCDLIVMGTHGRTGLAHLMLGSVAERVARAAPCPVLTVRPPNREPHVTAVATETVPLHA